MTMHIVINIFKPFFLNVQFEKIDKNNLRIFFKFYIYTYIYELITYVTISVTYTALLIEDTIWPLLILLSGLINI